MLFLSFHSHKELLMPWHKDFQERNLPNKDLAFFFFGNTLSFVFLFFHSWSSEVESWNLNLRKNEQKYNNANPKDMDLDNLYELRIFFGGMSRLIAWP